MSAATTTAAPIASTAAVVRALAAAEHFRSTGTLPSWAREETP